MALRPFEDFEFGGVDSRSNPLNMPQNRLLRCLNWVPKQDGHLEQRWGYSTISASTISATAITGLIPYTLWNGTRYVIRVQGTTPYQVAVSDGTVTSPTVRGAAISSSAKGSWYFFNNRLHYGNGTDQKWFDGTTWRDNGLRALTSSDISSIAVVNGVGELTSSQASTISLTAASSGTFSATTGTGFLFYVAVFDTTANEQGPATISVSSGRVTVTANQKITVANLPSITSGQVKLIARTGDSTSSAYFCTNTSTTITSCTRSSTTLTVVATSHGLSTGDVVVLSGTTNFDSVYSITVSDANTFTATLFQAVGQNTTGANTTGGTCKRVISVAAATTSVDVTSPAQDTSILVNDANRGLAVPSTGLANPGYQFYAAIYNPNGGGHIGNRLAIGGGRLNYSTSRVNVRITGLPDLSGTDSEWGVIIGRTGDGATIPYLCADSNGNFFFTASAQTSITLTTQGALAQSTIGQGVELPTRNGIIPASCDKFAVVGDYIYAADSVSPTIRRSASFISDRSSGYAGRPEQSWAPDDIDTFPTNQVPTIIAQVDLELFVSSRSHCAILTDLAGVTAWRGPWRKGGAGKRAFVTTDHGFFWVSGDKELCTFQNGLPIAISDEYQAAELAQIGSAFLSSVECTYYRNSPKGIDEIRIEAQKSDGTPYTIIHDFMLRDERSPFGQGRAVTYVGSLATAYTTFTGDADIVDSNGDRQIWAGASNGQIYQLYSGANDGGTEFNSDAIALVNAGPDRPNVDALYFYGDSQVVVSVAHDLNADTSSFTTLQGAQVPTQENDSLFRCGMDTPELRKVYVRFQLTSHSADGTLALNNPPHVPLETYGRIWEVIPAVGQARGL